MKTLFLPAVIAAAFALMPIAHSQAPTSPQSAVQRLQTIKTKNKELLDRQAETLKKLDALQLEAQQMKFLGKRG